MSWRDMRWQEKVVAPLIFAAATLVYYVHDVVAWLLALIGV